MKLRSLTTTAVMTAIIGAGTLATAGVAFAEGATVESNQTSTVSVTGQSTVSVVSQSTTTADGASLNTSVDTTTTSVDVPEAPSVAEEQTSSPAESTVAEENHPASLVADVNNSDSGTPVSPVSENVHIDYQIPQSRISTLGDLAKAAPVAPAAEHHEDVPSTPINGALHQFEATILSVPASLLRLVNAAGHAPIGLPVGVRLLVLNLVALTVIAVFGAYVSRLRRAGYSHAARSDAAGIFNLFATPSKVSFAWAYAPSRKLIFL